MAATVTTTEFGYNLPTIPGLTMPVNATCRELFIGIWRMGQERNSVIEEYKRLNVAPTVAGGNNTPVTTNKTTQVQQTRQTRGKGKSGLTAAGRKRIAEAQRARHAGQAAQNAAA